MLCQNCGIEMTSLVASHNLEWCSCCGTIYGNKGFVMPTWSKEPPVGELVTPPKVSMAYKQKMAGAYGKDVGTIHPMDHLTDENGDEKS